MDLLLQQKLPLTANACISTGHMKAQGGIFLAVVASMLSLYATRDVGYACAIPPTECF